MKRYSVVDGKLVELEGTATTVVRDASPGLGDVVAGAAKAVGIRPSKGCGCEKRREALNRATPKIVARLLDALRGYWSKWWNKGNFPLVVSADPVTVGGNGKKAHEAAG